MKRLLLSVVLLALAAAVVIAAGQEEATGGDEGAPQEVTIEWIQWFAAEGGEPVMKEIIAEFEEENPGVTVELVTLPFSRMRETIISNYAVGETSDVYGLNMPWATEFINKDVLEPIDSYLENAQGFDVDDLVSAPVEEIQGNSWMVPLTAHPFMLYGNLDLMEQAGIAEMPTTWEELRSAAEKIDNLGENVYGYNMAFSNQPPSNGPIIDLYPLLYTVEGGRTIKDGAPNLDSPQVIETLTFLNEMYEYTAPGVLSKPEQQKVEEFATGNVGFVIATMPMITVLGERAPNLDFDVGPVPKKDVFAFRVHGWEIGLASKSEHKEVAWAFVSKLLEPAVNARFAQAVNQLPGNTAASGDWITENEKLRTAQTIMQEHESVEELRKTPKAVSSWQLLTEEIQSMLSGDQSPEETAAQAQQRWEELFSE